MAKLIWTQPAYDDLNEISDYIALDKVTAAIKLVNKVLEKVERLENSPESGRLVPEFNNTKYREVIVPPCRILYYVEKENVYIIHVMRNESQLRRYMIQESKTEYKLNQ